MRTNSHVNSVSLRLALGYAEALELCRAQVNDPLAVAAVKEIDAELAAEKERATAKNADMVGRLQLDARAVAGLVEILADDPELETWLLRRVNLTRANGAVPDDDSHHENQ